MTQNTSSAVMAQRREPPDSLDFFPTPPWATRALTETVLQQILGVSDLAWSTCWEPAAGEGHMAEVLREAFKSVIASDVFDYGRYPVHDFLQPDGLFPSGWHPPSRPDWIITNPPFNHAAEFAELALERSKGNVALLVRLSWLEGAERFYRLFLPRPPAVVAVFSERVPMHRGRWEPDGSTATAYAWVIWREGSKSATHLFWVPPGQRGLRTSPRDRERFGAAAGSTPLLDDEGATP